VTKTPAPYLLRVSRHFFAKRRRHFLAKPRHFFSSLLREAPASLVGEAPSLPLVTPYRQLFSSPLLAHRAPVTDHRSPITDHRLRLPTPPVGPHSLMQQAPRRCLILVRGAGNRTCAGWCAREVAPPRKRENETGCLATPLFFRRRIGSAPPGLARWPRPCASRRAPRSLSCLPRSPASRRSCARGGCPSPSGATGRPCRR
jgi:hypothetical protein